MKEAILISKGDYERKNIGDYIQSISAKYFMRNASLDIEREEIDQFQSEEPVKCILNGWYMEHPEHWPPSKCIVPLLISIHINKTKAAALFENGGANYMMAHGPVGCRDKGTLKILELQGIPAYYSSCLTLTLGEQYKRTCVDINKVIFVDAYCNPYHDKYGRISINQAIRSLYCFFRNIIVALLIFKKYKFEVIDLLSPLGLIKSILYVGRFVETYKKKFSINILLNAMYISHSISKKKFKNEKEMYYIADKLLKEYASAILVVTSRLHCALPCLGIGTPVLFINSEITTTANEDLAPLKTGRFDGIMEFLNYFNYTNDILVDNNNIMLGKINYECIHKIKNKTNHNKYKATLIAKCIEFARQ